MSKNLSSSIDAGNQEAIQKQGQLRKFKKDSVIFGIPKKNSQIGEGQLEASVSTTGINPRQQNKAICDRLIISPDGRVYRYFNNFLIVLSIWSTISSAYYACFGMTGKKWLEVTDYTMEVFFLIDMIISFFKEYLDEETHKPVRDCKKIAKRYLVGIFIFDLVAWSTTPIILITKAKLAADHENLDLTDPNVVTDDGYNEESMRLLYMLRLLRFKKLLVVTQIQNVQSVIKYYYRTKLNSSIQRNSHSQENSKEDNNKIMQQTIFFPGMNQHLKIQQTSQNY